MILNCLHGFFKFKVVCSPTSMFKYATLDTGAICTTITTNVLSSLLTIDESYLINFVQKSSHLKCLRAASGERLRCAPVSLRNLSVGGDSISNLYAYLFISDNDLFVLGMDFIRSCDIRLHFEDEPTVMEFDTNRYVRNFSRLCNMSDVYEINNLYLDPVALAWCRQNAPEALRNLPDAELWELMKNSYNATYH